MIEKLSQREIRTLKIGAVCVAAILLGTFTMKWVDRWSKTRESLNRVESKLQQIETNERKQAALLSIVPVFEMPQAEEQQKFLFRDKFNEQLKKAGIKSEPLKVLTVKKSKQSRYKLLQLKCSGKCKFGQLLDLLATLNENPYLVGIEELRIKCDPKSPQEKREEIEVDLTVSTFVK